MQMTKEAAGSLLVDKWRMAWEWEYQQKKKQKNIIQSSVKTP